MSQLNFCQVHSRVGELSNKNNTAVHSHLVLGAPFMGYAHPHVRTIGPSAIATAYRKSKLSLAPCWQAPVYLGLAGILRVQSIRRKGG